MTLSRAIAGSCVTLLLTAGTLFLAPQASAEPCGWLGSGSGSSGSSGSSGQQSTPPQGSLPRLTGDVEAVAWVTGPRSINHTDERFSVSGTDLGIMWDNGAEGDDRQTLMAFGDTFGDCTVPGQEWRDNILMRTSDTDLSDGISVPDPIPGDPFAGSPVSEAAPNFSRELVGSLGITGIEHTVIPTAAIAVDGRQYINFMSVRQWGEHGEWWTNASMIGTSDDNGENWQIHPLTARLNVPLEIPAVAQLSPGHEKFQQHAYVRHDGYLYDYGTPAGRFGAAYLSRVAENAILDLNAYEYRTGEDWVAGDPAAATAVVPATVGEMSVQQVGDTFVMMYGNESRASIDMRTAPSPEGPWSEPRRLLQIPGLYAPFIHPSSTPDAIYFTASRWSDYNVMLLRTTLS